ncbi:hypothetical protein ACG5V6_00070 [Streptomyces chitinivorans]|uniref:Lipoprotein n=1 Tax=Streptomyces chitinivorans TaxID=1257027 RepID=A0ABW7HLW5_9ACTN|nr:hypothetical protein [Streptomyces chitinivorans]MDH2412046.1 hypothetical protein [Streptomyces chitinivorans]
MTPTARTRLPRWHRHGAGWLWGLLLGALVLMAFGCPAPVHFAVHPAGVSQAGAAGHHVRTGEAARDTPVTPHHTHSGADCADPLRPRADAPSPSPLVHAPPPAAPFDAEPATARTLLSPAPRGRRAIAIPAGPTGRGTLTAVCRWRI